MKILSAKQIRSADAYTISHEPVSSLSLMERAAKACFEKIVELFPGENEFHVFCGTGNNGGDGLVIARLLSIAGKTVKVYIVRFSNQVSDDCATNLKRLGEAGLDYQDIYDKGELPVVTSGIIIDALLGTGLSRPLSGVLSAVAKTINVAPVKVIAIDLPSGVYDRGNSYANLSLAVRADFTLSFEVPKLCFFSPDTQENIGAWLIIPIGLSTEFINQCASDYYTIDAELATLLLQERQIHSHKGDFGHALLAVGSKGKMGAALLSAEACLRSGAGLLTCFVPRCGYEIMQEGLPEAMTLTSGSEDSLDDIATLTGFDAVGTGPGIGTSTTTLAFINKLLREVDKPMVLDADALNIIAVNPRLLSLIPTNSILTPHPKEFERLFGTASGFEDKVALLRSKSCELKLILLLKGHHTAVALPDGRVFFNTTGNAGMATGGSGDVLTGIICSLLAQNYPPVDAALLGVFLHGLAGDLAAEKLGQEAMIASDIISNLGEAFKHLHSLQEK